VQGSLQLFLERFEPLRPELYRYCRYLTHSPWGAEDLAQDALPRAFATLGRMLEPPPNPRAWLFRVASNLWLDQLRRVRELSGAAGAAAVSLGYDPRPAREAAGTLIAQLAPQERAAVVLKDVFELSLEEVSEALATSVGSVKAALHRGRGKLAERGPVEKPVEKPAPSTRVLDAFCAAFNAQDLETIVSLLLDTASVEVVGASEAQRPGAARDAMLHGMLFGSRRIADGDPSTGLDPRFLHGVLPASPRCEVRVHRGEPLLLVWYAHQDGEAVRAINRVEVDGDHAARLRNYFYTPELIAEVCGELNVRYRSNGYRHCLTVRS
jgi:RNA polymerase sigma-70 factor (ECF subfamily)